jgi:hypothetical protein
VILTGRAIREVQSAALAIFESQARSHPDCHGILEPDFQSLNRIFLLQQQIAMDMCAYCNSFRKPRGRCGIMTLLELLLVRGRVRSSIQK